MANDRASGGTMSRIDRAGRMGCGLSLATITLFPILSSLLHSCDAQNSSIIIDAEALMAFKVAADPDGLLNRSWKAYTNPCGDVNTGFKPWFGIQCNVRGRVFAVTVSNLNLTGTFAENTLSRLDQLRYMTLSDNSFTGSLPDDLSGLTGLVQIRAQNAHFSGPFPGFLTAAKRLNLVVVILSGNNFTGQIPDLSGVGSVTLLNLSSNSFAGSIPALPPKLLNLDLSSNFLTGSIPPFLPSTLTNLSLSANQLAGQIPSNLAQRFPNSSFAGNAGLCGLPLSNPCLSPSPAPSPDTTTLGPSPGILDPSSVSPSVTNATQQHSSKKLSSKTIVVIVVADTLVLLLVTIGFLTYFRRRYTADIRKGYNDKKSVDNGIQEVEGGKLVFVEDLQDKFELEDLLRASAEMLGKGSFGSAYRAVLEGGTIVAVKRLRDVKEMEKEEFEQQMEMLGKLRHPNLVPLRAYYYAKEENLLVYDFMATGSLFSLLHGNRGPGRKPLDWNSRLQVAHGVALGLAYLHQECLTQNIPHGNIKSSNILLGENFEVRIADFGLVPLMTPAMAAQRMAGYRAPEFNHGNKISHKADVYSFGVLLLELLTGRQPAQSLQGDGIDLPKWVQSMVREEWTGEVFDVEIKTSRQSEEEMVALLTCAMACVTSNPDQRPKMGQVVKSIEDIFRVQEDSLVDSESEEKDDGGNRDTPSDP